MLTVLEIYCSQNTFLSRCLKQLWICEFQIYSKNWDIYILDLSYFVCFSYKNITDKLKREWYNFQIGTNEFLTEIFGEDEEEDNEISNKIDDDDET